MNNSWVHAWTRALKDLEQMIDFSPIAYQFTEVVRECYDNELYPREYHNLNHIFTGLDLLDEYEKETRTPLMPIVRYCWMLHDAKCEPGATDNEECSAFLAATIIGNKLPIDPILSTKPSREGSTVAGRIIRDVDWSYFGLPFEEFEHVTDTIRQEYKNLSNDEWKAGRKKFLESIDPEKIFWTPHFKKRFEANAKTNISKSIANLS